ncbi:hypothetical protein K8P10_000692 [Leucobacter sp. Psy1]|nr:hypothetical protein K8P10_000692 [Leucobacter sp. Psy1]
MPSARSEKNPLSTPTPTVPSTARWSTVANMRSGGAEVVMVQPYEGGGPTGSEKSIDFVSGYPYLFGSFRPPAGFPRPERRKPARI